MPTRTKKTRVDFKVAARNIEKLHANLGKKIPSGLRVVGEEIMLDVKASRPGKGVPVRTGALRASGRVEGPIHNEVHLTFGGAAAPYAVVVHEDTSIPHYIGESRFLNHAADRWEARGISVSKAMAEWREAVDAVIRARQK